MVRAIFRKPLTYFWRKFRPLTLLKNIGGEIISHRMVVMHPQFFLVVLLMVSYTILITLFHIFDIRLIIQAVPSELSSTYSGVRLRFYAYNKSLCKWGHFEKAKTTFKMLLATWFFVCFFKRFRSFVAENLESVGQRAAKLPAIKLWEWFETVQASNPGTLADWGRGQLSDFFLRPPTLTASNFAALWPTELIFTAFKVLNL